MQLSERALNWSEKVRQQEASGKSALAWCKEHSIPYHNFINWRCRLRKADQPDRVSQPSSFMELTDKDRSWLEISFFGAKLSLQHEFDRKGLLRFVQLLQEV